MPLESPPNDSSILLIGSGGHAKVVMDTLLAESRFRIVGIVDDFLVKGTEVLGLTVLGCIADIPQLDIQAGVIAVGDNWARKTIYEKIINLRPDFAFPSVIHPNAYLGRGVSVEAGAVVLAGSVTNTEAVIGRCSIVNTKASVDHDCRLAEFSSVGPGAVLAGAVVLGTCSAVGLGACVRERTTIGDYSIVGMGSAVVADVASNVVVLGVPARVIRSRRSNEPYLK